MNTTENNKKIAEFMGCKRVEHNLYEVEGKEKPQGYNYNPLYTDNEFKPDEMLYNYSWDWLMEVVEKINLIDDYKYTVIIKSMDVQIYNNVSGKIIFESECKWQPDELIKSLYEAVIAFIDWYNENGAKES